jgi:PAS domain S-box-containing protein
MKKVPKTRKSKLKEADPLRDQAERLLQDNSENPSHVSARELKELVHELQVHKVELEIQNVKLREAQEKLEESQKLYHELYDSAPVGYITMSTSGVILESNLAGADMFGMVRRRFLHKLFQGFVLPEDLYIFQAHRQRLLENKRKDTRELRMTKKGEVFFCRMESVCVRDGKGNPVSIRSALVDVTELKDKAEELRRATIRFTAIAENARDIISRRDRNLRCIYINPAVEAQLEIPRRAFLGRTLEETHSEFPEQLREAFAEVFRTGEEKTVEYESVTPKRHKSFQAIVIPEKDGKGAVESILTVARDITALKQTQKDLESRIGRRTAALERTNLKLEEEIGKRRNFEKALRSSTEKIIQEARKRRLLSSKLVDLLEKDRRSTAITIHDELGQLLTTIKMDLEMADSAAEEDARSLISRAKERIISAIEFSRNAVNQLRPVALDTIGLVPSLETLIEDIRKSSKKVSISFFSRPLPSTLDKEKELVLYRTAQEAITNALKHASPTNIFVSLIPKDKTVLLTIEDDGKGFDYMQQTTASPESGLGIGIMEERLAHVQGELRIESLAGKGTEVIAEVPIDENQ